MPDIFSEVDESLRHDRAADIWKRAAPFVIGGAVLLVAAVGAWEYMRYSKAQGVERQAQQYSEAMDSLEAGNFPAAETAFAEIAEGEGGFAALSSHMAASAARQQGDDEAAISHFANASAKADDIYGDLAILKSAYLQADALDLSGLEALVAPLLVGQGPTDALARELIAAKALASGDVERARRDYQALSLRLDDGQSLPAFQQRVQRAILALPQTQQTSTPPASEPVAADATTPTTEQDTPAQ